MIGSHHKSDIIIVGGGLVGLTLTLALAQACNGDLQITLVDPGALDPMVPTRPDARASALGAGSRRLFERLDVWQTLTADIQDVAAIDLTDSSLADAVRPVLLSYPAILGDGTPSMSIVSNVALLRALQHAVRRAPGVTIRAGQHVQTRHGQAIASTRDHATVTLASGEILTAALIVAADGRKSPLREAAAIKSVGWPYAQTGIVTSVTFELPHHGRAVQHFLPAGPFAILPLPGNRACLTWTESADTAERLMASDTATFAAAVDQRAGGTWGRIAVDGPRQSWPLEMFLARALVAERLALIGDAARSVHPLAGQGLNLGLRDVAALAETLVDAARTGQDIGALPGLEAYERWRRADGALSATSFELLNRMFSNDWAILRTIRSAGLGVVDRLPALKTFLLDEASGLTGRVPRLLRGEAL
jgi:2-octaprenyl-6-methoxyphenol hydroxylase